MTVRDVLDKNMLAGADHDLWDRTARERLLGLLREDDSITIVRALRPFLLVPPHSYWSFTAVEAALDVLEGDSAAALAGFQKHSAELDRGFANILRRSRVWSEDDSLSESRAADLLRLTTEYHPAYLRIVEHIHGNLLPPFWSAARRSATGKYIPKNAVELLRQRGLHALCIGYVERYRNAIAHGQVAFSALGIRYGIGPHEADPAGEFLQQLDELLRTCNALAVSLILFLARGGGARAREHQLPPTVSALIAAAAVERSGLEVFGAVESESALAGSQLHIAMKTEFLAREVVLYDAARLALALIDNGATRYDRLLVEVYQNRPVAGLIPVRPLRLRDLLTEDAGADRVGEIFDETVLLWHHESKWTRQFKTLRRAASSAAAIARRQVLDSWHEAGFALGKGRYQLRHTERVGSRWSGGVKLIVILRSPMYGADKAVLRHIIRDAVRRGRRSWRRLVSPPTWVLPPKYVVVSVYANDGPLRWVTGQGWLGGNLLAVGERVYGMGEATRIVINPQERWKNIHIRWEPDRAAMAEAGQQLLALAAEIHARRQTGV